MALKRPVEMSQARALAGMPSRGHCSTAAAKASCSASSASSKPPSRRMSVASTQRDSARYTASITRVVQLLDRPDLDHRDARRREPRGDRAGLVHFLGLDEEESTQLLLCLGKGAGGGGDLSGAGAAGPGRPDPPPSGRGGVVAPPSAPAAVTTRAG